MLEHLLSRCNKIYVFINDTFDISTLSLNVNQVGRLDYVSRKRERKTNVWTDRQTCRQAGRQDNIHACRHFRLCTHLDTHTPVDRPEQQEASCAFQCSELSTALVDRCMNAVCVSGQVGRQHLISSSWCGPEPPSCEELCHTAWLGLLHCAAL